MFLLIDGPFEEVLKQNGDFNTSHVSINQKRGTGRKLKIPISIHLMFLLIIERILHDVKYV